MGRAWTLLPSRRPRGAFRAFCTPIAVLVLFIMPALLLVAHPRTAYAYLDPGTGSMLFQTLVASVMAGVFILKTRWRDLRARVGKIAGRGEPASESTEGDKD